MTIIATNTTWQAGQAITLFDDVQIAPGVTLTIEPGATVNGNGRSVVAFGMLDVNGTASNAVNLNNLRVYFGGDYNKPGRIEIDHAKISGGTLFPATGNAVYGSFSVTNSILNNTGSSYIWYPTSDSNFSGNIFVNAGSLSIGTSGVTLKVNDNIFINSGSSYGYNGSAAIIAWANYGNPAVVTGNSFLGNGIALEVSSGYSSASISAANNYFGTTDMSVIHSRILDRNDDLNRYSVIAIDPVASAPSEAARAALAASGLTVILGTSGSDRLTGTDSDDMIDGAGGNDTIEGGLGNDVTDGGDGDDYITDIGGSDTLRGGAGDDRIFISRGNNGTTEHLRIEGGSGNDIVTYQNYRAGSVSIDLGDGDDRVTLWTQQSGGTLINMGQGRDVLEFSSLYDWSSDSLITITDFAAGSNGDTLDITQILSRNLIGWNGSNPFGNGYARLVQSGSTTIVQIDRDAGGSSHGWITVTTLQSVSANMLTAENLGGFTPGGFPSSDRNLIGTASADTLSGLDGNDIIQGMDGNDTLSGGAGNDTIDGGAGNDTIEGGFGNDVIDGSDGDDYITDIGGSDTLRGGAGNDRIFISRSNNGTTENLQIEGGAGNDIVTYQNYRASSVSIDLGDGDDRITLWTQQSGGTLITMGQGRDVLEFSSLYSLSEDTRIRITDFAAGTGGDIIDLTNIFSQNLSGWNGYNPFETEQARLVQAGSDTLVQIDRDAAGSSYGWVTLATLQSTNAYAMSADNVGGYAPIAFAAADVATAYVTTSGSVGEGSGTSLSINLILQDVSRYTGTVTLAFDAANSTMTASEVNVPAFSGSYGIWKSPAGDHVINLPNIGVVDDLSIEGDEILAFKVTASGQIFSSGTDNNIVTVTVKDNDWAGTASDDQMEGDAGNNYLLGLAGNDVINGYGGNDWLVGGDGHDQLNGDDGDDRLEPGAGNNIVDGGAGIDTLILSGARSTYSFITSNGWTYLVGKEGASRIVNVERISFAGENLAFEALATNLTAFDGLRYTASHTDLLEAFGTDAQAAAIHYTSSGFSEGRDAKSFDGLQYTASYTDLSAAFGTDVEAATRHYIETGSAEGRIADNFDGLRYIASNADLITAFGNDDDMAAWHYITSGRAEGRNIDSFDALQYAASYTDLAAAVGTDMQAATRHYIESGFAEGRSTDNFDGLRYIASNTDLITAFGNDDDMAAWHYLAMGRAEGREIDSFDALQYAASYTDLADAFGTDAQAATRHFIESGFAEGRSPDSFDGLRYIASNADLITAIGNDDDMAAWHYVTMGRTEGRQLYAFDALAYAAANPDLSAAFGTDTAALTEHYINIGYSENRNIFGSELFLT